jgi:UTP--glucose-1-phosphate uridylyltransferase
MGKPIRKAVIAAAGFGTRFLPQTKAMPKEMLPIVDKPIIQYVVEELVEAGIEDIIIVTGYSKRAVEDHFDYISADLRANLKKGGKLELLEETKRIASLANFIYVRMKGVYGSGTPLLNVEHLIGDEPFIYTWGDDFMVAKPERSKQLISYYEKFQAPIMASIRAQSDQDYERYGFAAGEEVESGVIKMNDFVEKPGVGNAPSDVATVSGYVLTPEIFPYLVRARDNLPEDREFYFQDALNLMLEAGKPVYACEIKGGKYYDAGNKLEYLKTVVDFALMRDDIKGEFADYLRGLSL